VSRALGLIEGGALGEGSVEALADRLGIGERQLRRLFKQHLGASPTAVATTRRVLLAKQLIHDTHLPMAEVAMAAGFGSVRRFNETFQKLYGRPPRVLRRSGAADASIASSGDVRLRLPYRSPFDWDAILAFFGRRAIPGVEVVHGRTYARSVAIGRARGGIFVEPGDGAFLSVTVHFPQLDALPAIIARVRRIFDLTADPIAIGAHLAEDPLLEPLVASRPGLRVPGSWDGFELGVRAIVGQQITVSAARRLTGALAASCGEPSKDPWLNGLGLTHLFPDPAAVVDAPLSTLAMPRTRIEALRALARAAMTDPSLLATGRRLDEAAAELRTLRGIGEWTAQYIAMRQLGEPDAFPVGDVGLARALACRVGRRPTQAEVLARAERWRPWRAYAAIHLWASLADPLQSSVGVFS
jgi:AraC family transcriptional regulator of adaptative response / DNA-3-methyladenine glycosylase II